MLNTQIKGFKHLRPGAECAVLRTERFGRGRDYVLGTIKRFDVIAGEIEVTCSWRTFGMDGYEIGHTGGEPRQRLIVPVPDEVRAEVWRSKSKERVEMLLYNWATVDDRLIQAIIEALDSRIDSSDKNEAPDADASKAS